ncbi:MAG: M24 family metallopeptidase [Gemmatimonadota bacterium]
MKSDLDRLLQERDLDALVVTGPDGMSEVNAPYRWFVGDAHVTGMVLKKRGEPPMLLHHDMERDAAAATGLRTVSSSRWPIKQIYESAATQSRARVELYRRVFLDLGIGGRVALTGVDETASALAFWGGLREALPALELVVEADGTVLDEARLTKDADEIERLEEVARETCAIVEDVRALLAGVAAGEAGQAGDADGPLTIGDVRRFVQQRVHARGLSTPGGFILSANRDAGVPHNTGDDGHVLAAGDVVLFDFFPRGSGGYYHDVSRTWSLGAPRPEVQAVYNDVLGCFGTLLERVQPGASTRELQQQTCEIFEEAGHVTVRQDPSSTSGYVHSLGHGLGLDVHEQPHFPSFRAGRDTRLEPGMVVTIEPGLYYPERGLGVRIEDTVLVTETGARSLSAVPTSLEVGPGAGSAQPGDGERSERVRLAIAG